MNADLEKQLRLLNDPAWRAQRLKDSYRAGMQAARNSAASVTLAARGKIAPEDPPTGPRKNVIPFVRRDAEALQRLRDACLSIFNMKPLATVPSVVVEQAAHFAQGVRAHYHPDKNLICFNTVCLASPSDEAVIDVMKHELLHAWIHQNGLHGDRPHDDVFKAASDLLGIPFYESWRHWPPIGPAAHNYSRDYPPKRNATSGLLSSAQPAPSKELVVTDVAVPDIAVPDVFDEGRIRQSLAEYGRLGLLQQFVARLRGRFTRAGEVALMEQWIGFYETGLRLASAMVDVDRKRVEHQQLARDHVINAKKADVEMAKLQADIEDHELRREKAAYQRQHVERYIDGRIDDRKISEHELKLKAAQERRQLDCRWELHESLRSLHTLIELQHWRRNERHRILADRSLTPEEQREDLQFVDDLFEQKRKDLNVDMRITED